MAKAVYRIEGQDATAAAFRSVLGNAKTTADKMSSIYKTAFAGIGATAAASAILNIGRQAIEAGDNLEKFKVKAKLSAESASSLAYAAKLSDVEIDGLGDSLQKMQIFLSKADSGMKGNVETLAALGLGIGDIKGLEADKQFELIADQVARLGSEEDQARAVTEVFGKAGGQLLPMFQQGAKGIRAAREEAQRLGLVLNDQQLEELAAADESVKRLSASWEHFGQVLTAKVSPALRRALDAMSGFDSRSQREKYDDEIESVESQLRSYVGYGGGVGGVSPGLRDSLQRQLSVLYARRKALDTPMPSESGGSRTARSHLPLGYGAVADSSNSSGKRDASAAQSEDEKRAEAYAETMERANETIFAQGQEIADEEMEASLERLQIIEDARKESEDALAGYKADLANEEYDRQREFVDTLSDDLTDVLMRGGDGFEDMLKRWAADFLNSNIRKLLDQTFSGGGGSSAVSAGGGIWGMLGSLAGNFIADILGFADGGRPPVGRPSIVGERGPELFVPDSAGTVLPNPGLGGNMSNRIEVHVHTSGGADSKQDGKRLGKIIADVVEERIATKMRRRGYRFD